MHINKKLMHRIFGLIAGAIVFAWLVLDTSRATKLFTTVWDLIEPFVVGAGIAFIFNVPMRAIENQMEHMKKAGIRRGLSIILTATPGATRSTRSLSADALPVSWIIW